MVVLLRIIRTHETDFDTLPPWDQDQVYNGIDICVTHDVHGGLKDQFDEYTQATYDFSRELQGPVLEMGFRGCLVDKVRRDEVLDTLFERMESIETNLNRIVIDGVGMLDFNWRSPQDLQTLFYGELGLPKIRRQGRVTADRNAREELQTYPIATQIAKHINAIADLGKKIDVLRTGIDPDGRIRTRYNIAGASTGRFSSSLSEFGTGGNLQNIEELIRAILIADFDYKFAKMDAKSGESFVVGAIEWNLFRDSRYLDACESGDPHTAVARICWPNLPWTGDLRRDKEIAEKPYYRHYTYRFMCKKLGHGSNYGGQPDTLAEQSKLPINVVADFQPKYFRAFPAHKQWQEWTREELRKVGYLISLMGRKRYFFGRRTDPDVIREAIAYDPQSSLADIVNRALLKLWKMNLCPIVFQDHDALTFMYPEEQEDEIIPELMKHLIVPVPLAHGRELRIPYDCEVGWNKGKFHPEKNPDGLLEYKGHDNRKRSAETDILDRVVHRTNPKLRFARHLA